MIKVFKVTSNTEYIDLNIDEYIKSKVKNFDPKDKWHNTPKAYLENYWGTLEIENGYYYFHSSWGDIKTPNGLFYQHFYGTEQELSDFIEKFYKALDFKYQKYLKQKEKNNYKSIIGKIKNLPENRIKELKQFLSNYN